MERTQMSKSDKIIDALALLETIKRYSSIYHKPLTAKALMEKKWRFAAPSVLLRSDTLRMWLWRKKRKNLLRRKKVCRSYCYILTKQGLKMIKYLKNKKAERENKRKMEAEQRNAQAQLNNFIDQLLIVKALEQKKQERRDALKSILNIIIEAKNR